MKKKRKTAKLPKPAAIRKAARILKDIIAYSRAELCYDEFAYGRMSRAYKLAAKDALDCIVPVAKKRRSKKP